MIYQYVAGATSATIIHTFTPGSGSVPSGGLVMQMQSQQLLCFRFSLCNNHTIAIAVTAKCLYATALSATVCPFAQVQDAVSNRLYGVLQHGPNLNGGAAVYGFDAIGGWNNALVWTVAFAVDDSRGCTPTGTTCEQQFKPAAAHIHKVQQNQPHSLSCCCYGSYNFKCKYQKTTLICDDSYCCC